MDDTYDNHTIAQYIREQALSLTSRYPKAKGMLVLDSKRIVRNNILRAADRLERMPNTYELHDLWVAERWEGIGEILDIRKKSLKAALYMLRDFYSQRSKV